MGNLKEAHYDAFISYRHNEKDSYIAKSIHKRLESFRLPRSLRKNSDKEVKEITRIFRDEEELPLSADLSETINNALQNSDYLICICTPDYLSSSWCIKEVETFLRIRDHSHILVVLADGEPEDSFPEILTFEDVEIRDDDGTVRIERKSIEPLAADVRGQDKKEINKKMEAAVMRLCAAIIGVNYDDLRQRHREAKLKRLVALSTCIGVCLLAFGIFVSVTFLEISRQNDEISKQNTEINKQNMTIREQYAELRDKHAASVAETANEQLSKGRRMDAIEALYSVMPEDDKTPYNPKAVATLYKAMNTYGIENKYAPVKTYDMDFELASFDVSYDTRYIMLDDNMNIRIFDVQSGEVIADHDRPSGEAGEWFGGCFCGSSGYIITDKNGSYYYSLTGGEKRTIEMLGDYIVFDESKDGKITLFFCDDVIGGIDNDGKVRYRIDLKKLFGKTDMLNISSVSFDKGRFAYMLNDGKCIYLVVADEKDGRILYSDKKTCKSAVSCTLSGETIIYTTAASVETKVHAVDIRSKKLLWDSVVSEYVEGNIIVGKKKIYLYGDRIIVSLNAKDGKSISVHYPDETVIKGWMEDDGFAYLCSNAKLYIYKDNSSFEYTDTKFVFAPEEGLRNVTISGESMFCCNERADNVVRYSVENAKGCETIGKEYEGKYSSYQSNEDEGADNAEDVLKDSPDVSMAMVDNAIYSEDKKLIVATLRDHTLQIVDASTLKQLTVVDVRDQGWIEGVRFSELTDSYMIDFAFETIILDKDYNVISETCRIVDEVGDSFVMMNAACDYYKLPYVSYEELLLRTKQLLNGT